MLRSVQELRELADFGEPAVPYMDRVLAAMPRRYRRFVLDLHSRDLIHWTTSPRDFVAVFFVRKKDNRLRMIIDSITKPALQAAARRDTCVVGGLQSNGGGGRMRCALRPGGHLILFPSAEDQC
eukprot:3795378-Heterocapsa_arctica.AAC.1